MISVKPKMTDKYRKQNESPVQNEVFYPHYHLKEE